MQSIKVIEIIEIEIKETWHKLRPNEHHATSPALLRSLDFSDKTETFYANLITLVICLLYFFN